MGANDFQPIQAKKLQAKKLQATKLQAKKLQTKRQSDRPPTVSDRPGSLVADEWGVGVQQS